MQYFGRYDTRFDKEFLVESYLYFNKDESEINSTEFNQLIKSKKLKKNNIVGTIFMYNPFVYPIGLNDKVSLKSQGFEFNYEFYSLKIEREIASLRTNITYNSGEIIEIKNLFNLNTPKIDTPQTLISLNNDIEKLVTSQLTVYDRDMNYQDINSLIIYGKFIFFAWGTKINKKEFVYIHDYAQNIYHKCIKTQKKIAFIYKKSAKQQYAENNLFFQYPSESGRYKNRIQKAIKESFSTNPPLPTFIDDLN